jgi:hypothetical protein
MSGFLNRIASSAARPQASAHPFVESIYPSLRREELTSPLTQYGTAVAAAAQSQMGSLGPELLEEASRQDGQLQPHRAGPLSHQPHSIEDREAFRPLLPQRGVESAVEVMRANLKTERSETESFTLSEASRLEDKNSQESLDYKPLVAEEFILKSTSEANRLSPIRTLDEDKIVSSLPGPGRPAPLPATAHSAPSHVDDIQIHIGRIEVVAIPQAAPRPAPAPTRKGVSLDEYLHRRNGRVG